MIKPPHFDSYSVQARICLGIAIFSAALLVAATVLMNAFDIRKVALSFLRPAPIDITRKAPAEAPNLDQRPLHQASTCRYPMPPIGPSTFQLKFGRTSAPRLPQAAAETWACVWPRFSLVDDHVCGSKARRPHPKATAEEKGRIRATRTSIDPNQRS